MFGIYYVDRIMNKEGDHNVERDAVEGPMDCVCRDVMVQAINELKPGKAH